jgi:hypothetical protein
MASPDRLPAHVDARLLRPGPAHSVVASIARRSIEGFNRDEEKRRHANRVKVALLWSAEYECETLPDGDDAWIIID